MQAAFSFAVLIACFFVIPFAAVGLALVNTGMARSRNAAHAVFTSMSAMASAALAYVVIGQSIAGWNGGPAAIFRAGGVSWNWSGASAPFLTGLPANSSAPVVALFGVFSASLLSLIPLGSGAERWRPGPACVSSALLGGIIFPLFLHWAWNGGWLAQTGFLDTAGSGVIHAVGGLSALAVAWILGPRRGKYTSDGVPLATPGHNAAFVVAGCLMALPGWLALNVAAALVFHAFDAARLILIVINTAIAAAAAALAAAAVTRLRFGKPDASLTANGWLTGIAAIAAGAVSVPAASAVFIGLCAGILAPLSVELLELRLKIDDPGGAVSVHGVGGLWGLVAAALLGRVAGSRGDQLIAQLVGVATLIGCILPLSYALNWLVDRVRPMRASKESERQGMDLYELGAGAYPEFMTHTDEFMQR